MSSTKKNRRGQRQTALDEVMDFFDLSKTFTRKSVPVGCISGSVAALAGKPRDDEDIVSPVDGGTEYAACVAEKELLKLEQLDLDAGVDASSGSDFHNTTAASTIMDDLESLSSESDSEEDAQRKSRVDDIYERYEFNMNFDRNLPIYQTRNEILHKIRSNTVVVLEGDTGSGKTTQVPQYILEDAFRRREYCNIVCTQPRRIAAISIARRVCQERKWEEGSVVGYQVGLHANLCEDTRLLYCTTGVLLQRLIRQKSLDQFTHIILDEVHEREVEMDFLLIVIRRLLTTGTKRPKIILMSATINSVEFSNYFKICRQPAPIVKVDSRRLYQVKEFYLCDLDRINGNNVQVDLCDPGISNEMYNIAVKLVLVIDNIEQQETAQSLNAFDGAIKQTSILIFLPGIGEIDIMCKRLEQLSGSIGNRTKLSPIRLHSLIPPDEQVKVFHQAPAGFRKVILATNIAESSITVPDVKYVIDFCLNKSMITDSASKFCSLKLHWASKANCKQRSGRAGRVMNGRVYRLVPKYFYENYMEDYGIPEILRCPLENVVLKAKVLDMGPPPDILGLALNPPNLTDIHNTIMTLKELGALFTTTNGFYSVQDGDISFMGRIMSSLPLDIRLSRLIVLGHIFSILEDTIIIAAALSVRSIFKVRKNTPQGDCQAYIQSLAWADGSGSDLFAVHRAYKMWCSMREQSGLREGSGEYAWANRFNINLRSIKEMHLLIEELTTRLAAYNVREQTSYQRVHWIDREKTIILKIVIAGAFYPNYFTRASLNDTVDERSVYHVLCGNDPCNTVYFTNFTIPELGQLYTRNIKALFRDVQIPEKDIEVTFQSGSEKVFVTFKGSLEECEKHLRVQGKVRPEVYKALRMRLSNLPKTINIMDRCSSYRYAEQRGYGRMVNGEWQPNKQTVENIKHIALPWLDQNKIRGYISHIEHCGKFFFLSLEQHEKLQEMTGFMNDPKYLNSTQFQLPSEVRKGMVVLAPLKESYQRAQVLKIFSSTVRSSQFKVYFIDHGCTGIVAFDSLRKFSDSLSSIAKIPPRVFECRLARVEPTTVQAPNGKWPASVNEYMAECVKSDMVVIEIFSVVHMVANVVLRLPNKVNFNDLLVEKNLARRSDENYLSKMDHDYRRRHQASSTIDDDETFMIKNMEYITSLLPAADAVIEPPPLEQCRHFLKLRGPYSPLEVGIFSAMRAGTWKSVHIDRESVNSVLIETDPQDVHDRMIVAAHISETQAGDTIVARNTTLMPNIHGFGALMTMLFCPTMQIKRNKRRTKYVALLAGLGHDTHTYKSLYPEHDVLFNLDVEIQQDDFEMINSLRYCMDTILLTDGDNERPCILPQQLGEIQAKIKDNIIRLLSKNRKFIEKHSEENDNVWEYHEPSELLETPNLLGDRCIFPMLSALRLQEEKYDDIQALLVHCEELHNISQLDSCKALTCRLCNKYLENIMQIRLHLLSHVHRDREQQIRYKSRI